MVGWSVRAEAGQMGGLEMASALLMPGIGDARLERAKRVVARRD
jgi:hypothetical protein